MQLRQVNDTEFLQDNEKVQLVYFAAHLEPSIDAFDHHKWELYLRMKVKKENITINFNKSPVSRGRKEGLRVVAEEDILPDKAGLAGAKRPFLTIPLEDRPLATSAATISRL